MDIAQAISDYGFPIVLSVGMGYFVYFVWQFITEKLDPEIETMHIALIKLIDQIRMLDQDMIRLQQKLDVVKDMKRKNDK
jgi:hypothetical protein